MTDLENVEAPVASEAPEIKADNAPEVKTSADVKDNAPAKAPMRWYVIQAFSGFEQRVAVTLTESIKLHHLEDDFGEVLVPKEKVKEIKNGKKHESERKFFPG